MRAGVDTPRARARFQAALAAIDAANADDPQTLEVRGERRPKELAHSALVSEWIERLRPDASEALRLAARSHHIRRWEIPRDRHPKGRPGYLRWRKELQKHHASVTAGILREVGYDDPTIARVQNILRKRDLGRDDEVQAFEDALCLAFLETQLSSFSQEHDSTKASAVLAKTLKKMSPTALRFARELPLADPSGSLLRRALDSATG